VTYTEDQLIEGLLKQEPGAYRYAVKNYHAAMVKLSRAIVGEAFAEEVVQDAWISIIKGLSNFQRRSSLKTWVLRIVSNTAKTRIKKESKYKKLSYEQSFSEQEDENYRSSSELQWHLDTPDAIIGSHELRQHIQFSFDNLPAMQQAVLTLIDVEGLSTSDVCSVLNITENNVRVLIHRARLKIRKAICEYQCGSDVKITRNSDNSVTDLP